MGLLDEFLALLRPQQQPPQQTPAGLPGNAGGPLLAEALNPRLALARRMAAEGQDAPGMPDQAMPRYGRQWAPEEIARQRAALALILQQRDTNGR